MDRPRCGGWFMERPRGSGDSWIALGVVAVHGSPSVWWLFMDRPRGGGGGSWNALQKTVAIHGTPLEKRWLFMDRPRGGGCSWIALQKWWLFMDSPRGGGGSWIALYKTGGCSWIASRVATDFHNEAAVSR